MAQATLPLSSSPVVRTLGSLTAKMAPYKIFAQRVFDKVCPPASRRRFIITQVLPQTVLGIAGVTAFLYMVLKAGHVFRHQVIGISNEEHHFPDYFIEFILGMVVTVVSIGCLVGIVNPIYESCSTSYATWMEKEKSLLPLVHEKQDEDLARGSFSSRWAICKIFAQRMLDKTCPHASRRRFFVTEVLPKVALVVAALATYVFLASKLGHLVHYLMTGESAAEHGYKDYFVEFIVGTMALIFGGFCIGAPLNAIYENCSKSHSEWVEREKAQLLRQQEEERRKKEIADNAALHRAS